MTSHDQICKKQCVYFITLSKVYHRAGAYADWDFSTLLFQKKGQNGLEICPDREAVTAFGIGDEWAKVEAATG
jgi:isopenicillin N synthase-like dioxygenase